MDRVQLFQNPDWHKSSFRGIFNLHSLLRTLRLECHPHGPVPPVSSPKCHRLCSTDVEASWIWCLGGHNLRRYDSSSDRAWIHGGKKERIWCRPLRPPNPCMGVQSPQWIPGNVEGFSVLQSTGQSGIGSALISTKLHLRNHILQNLRHIIGPFDNEVHIDQRGQVLWGGIVQNWRRSAPYGLQIVKLANTQFWHDALEGMPV